MLLPVPPRQPGGGWLIIVLLLSLPASCMATAVIIGLRGQAFEAVFISGAAGQVRPASDGIAGSRAGVLACHRWHVAFVAGSAQAAAPE